MILKVKSIKFINRKIKKPKHNFGYTETLGII